MIARYLRSLILVLAAGVPCAGHAQDISLKPGESADLHSVYWVSNCVSTLLEFGGVDILEGPPGLEITIRRADVEAKRQNCVGKVPGGVLVLSAKAVEANWSGVLKYRVNYRTRDGNRQSSHQMRVALYAK